MEHLIQKIQLVQESLAKAHSLLTAVEAPTNLGANTIDSPAWALSLSEKLDSLSMELKCVVRDTAQSQSSSASHENVNTERELAPIQSAYVERAPTQPVATQARGPAQPETQQSFRSTRSQQSTRGDEHTFSCNYAELSHLVMSKFQKFSSARGVEEKGYFKLAVDDLPAAILDDVRVRRPGKDHFTRFTCRRDPLGYVALARDRQAGGSLPCFPLPACHDFWSKDDLKTAWENFLRGPPRHFDYIIGDCLFPDIELSPVEGLRQIGAQKLRGIGMTYTYLSNGLSCSIMHEEDAKLRSLNLLRAGRSKIWLIVSLASEAKLQFHMR